ncbi:MAG TPA: hypothetical protein VFK54_06220 [Candidatus Limnocylindrales bacterium]|nr:hypothetical protein [Candidatus Limnocylindrales bacterium]
MSNHEADAAARGGSSRYGRNPGSGSNEPKQHERKEQRPDWVPRQGGDQTRRPDEELRGGEGTGGPAGS